MFNSLPNQETPAMTLQELVESMQQYHAQTGAYRPEDVYRLVGDPRKGIGLGASFEACHPENHAEGCGAGGKTEKT